jgi:hypothetical protein
MPPNMELFSYVLLTGVALYRLYAILKVTPVTDAARAKAWLFTSGMCILVLRFWLIYFGLLH